MSLFKRIFFVLICTAAVALAQKESEARTRIKNYLELPAALEATSGISSLDPEIRTSYERRASSFPTQGNISEVNAEFLLNFLDYSSFFCAKKIEGELRLPPPARATFYMIPENQSPRAWSPESIELLIAEFSKMFWNQNVTRDEKWLLTDNIQALTLTLPDSKDSIPLSLLSSCLLFTGSLRFLRDEN